MKTTLKIAFRNILKHRRRSLVTVLTVVTGMAGIVLFGGFFQANYTGLRESVIRSQFGHVQIFRKGYEDNYRTDAARYRLDSAASARLAALLEADPDVEVFSRRIETSGLLGNASGSQAVMLRGMDPEQESLINSSLTMLTGADVSSDEPEGVILGEGLAKALGAKEGDDLSLLGTTSDGAMNGVDVKVVGTFQSFSQEYDDRAMMGTVTHASLLLGTPDVDKMVVLLKDTEKVGAFLARFDAAAEAAGLELEYKTWDELATFYHKVVDLYDSFFLIINLIVVVIILFGISNTMSMSVLERTREIGVLRALGTRRSGILRLFLTEGVLLALVGSALGILLACGLAWGITSLEILMPPPPGSSKGYPLRIEYVPLVCLTSTAIIVAVAAASAYLPSRKASRQQIVDALRFV